MEKRYLIDNRNNREHTNGGKGTNNRNNREHTNGGKERTIETTETTQTRERDEI
jgi:hypothetical protein